MSETDQTPSPWQPTVEFYKGDPKAYEIRRVCLGVLEKIRKLLGDPKVMEDRVAQQNLYAALELDEGRLIELGVSAGMHVGKPLPFFELNPLHAAQFVAGQLMPMTGEHLVSENDIVSLTKKFRAKLFNEKVSVFNSQNVPGEIIDLDTNIRILWAAEKMLAVPENYQEE